MTVNNDVSSLSLPSPGPPGASVELLSDGIGSSMNFYPEPGPPGLMISSSNEVGTGIYFLPDPGPPTMEMYSNPAGEAHLYMRDTQGDLGLNITVNDVASVFSLPSPGPPDNSIGFTADDNSSIVQLFGMNPGPPQMELALDASSSSMTMLNPTLPAIQMNLSNGGPGASLVISDTDIPILTMMYDGANASFAMADPGRTGTTFSAIPTEQRYTNATGDLLAQITPAGFNFISPGPPDINVSGSAAVSDGKLGIYLADTGVPPNPCVEFGYDGSAANLLMINPGPPESYSLSASFSQFAGSMSFYNAIGDENVRFDGDGTGLFRGNLGIGPSGLTPSNILTIEQRAPTSPIADAWTTYSSRRWKKNIKTLDHAMDKVKRLRGVTFDWKADNKHDIGLIAEEVGEVIPEVVTYEENGVDAKSVDYARLVSVLIEAVKEQQARIDRLEGQVAELSKASMIRDTHPDQSKSVQVEMTNSGR